MNRSFLTLLLITGFISSPTINSMKVSLPSKKSVTYFTLGLVGTGAAVWYFWPRPTQKKTSKRVLLNAELRAQETAALSKIGSGAVEPTTTNPAEQQAPKAVALKEEPTPTAPISAPTVEPSAPETNSAFPLEAQIKAPAPQVILSTLEWELNTNEIQRKDYLLSVCNQDTALRQLLVKYYALKEERIKKSTPQARVEELKQQEQKIIKDIKFLLLIVQ